MKIFKENYKIFMTFSYFAYAPFTFKKRNAKIYSTFHDKMTETKNDCYQKKRKA